ncbi:hypothetical protein ACLOAV_001238 [Pseudogymnoascus australis]
MKRPLSDTTRNQLTDINANGQALIESFNSTMGLGTGPYSDYPKQYAEGLKDTLYMGQMHFSVRNCEENCEENCNGDCYKRYRKDCQTSCENSKGNRMECEHNCEEDCMA